MSESAIAPQHVPDYSWSAQHLWSADYLGEEIPEEEDEPEPMGDLRILADLGLSDFDLGAILDDLDMGSDEMLMAVADKIKLNPQFRKVAEAALHG